MKRFWKKAIIPNSSKCWEWQASKNPFGYGWFYFEKMKLAHRVAWELTFGPIPENMCVLHQCDNPGCVNPKHLFLGTRDDNVKDMDRKGRRTNYNSYKLYCKHGHKFSKENTFIWYNKKGAAGRGCKECRRYSCRKQYYKRRKIEKEKQQGIK